MCAGNVGRATSGAGAGVRRAGVFAYYWRSVLGVAAVKPYALSTESLSFRPTFDFDV